MNRAKKDRILYVDILRIITIYCVVIFHICTNRWFAAYTTETMTEWHIINILVCLLRWCVPVFFMLSGIMYLDPENNVTIKKLYTKSIPRLLGALIFWSIVYRAMSPLISIVLSLKKVTADDWHKIYSEIFFGIPWHHLWFIYPLIGMYIMTPLFRVFTAHAKRDHYIYFLILFIVFGAIIPMLRNVWGINISFRIDELNSYFGYFIAGYFFYKFELKTNEKRILYTLGIISLIYTYVIVTYSASVHHFPGTEYFDRVSPHIALSSFFIFVLVKNIINKNSKFEKYKNNQYITLLANCVFGIYLIHDIFNVLLKDILHFDTSTFTPILSIPIYSIFVFGMSLLAVLLIRKIPILNKWII